MKSGLSLSAWTLSLIISTQLFFCASLQGQESKVGLNQVLVYRPATHDRDLPKVIFEKIYDCDCDGKKDPIGQRVTIPPTVHVHRYYYSGDREFQGPIIGGGPTMVVAQHPKTGKQMYVDVILPAGAPKIVHDRTGITYVFKDKRIFVKFHGFRIDEDRAFVGVQGGRGLGRNVSESLSRQWQKIRKFGTESPITEAVKSSASDVKNVSVNLTQGVGDVFKQAYDTTKTAVEIVPGVKALLQPHPDQAQKSYLNRLRAADSKARRTATKFIRTNR